MANRNELHQRNKHNGSYDFPKLIAGYPALEPFVLRNPYGTLTINFFDPRAVKALNKALLASYYNIRYWDIPKNYLCPPIPGRADYIHYIADLLHITHPQETSEGAQKIRCLDIGTGANCIYPIIGCTEYGWTFVGTDIDPVSLANAQKISTCNPVLAHQIELRLQPNSQSIFKGIIQTDEFFDITLCNPPFHTSQQEAEAGTLRKLSSLKGKKVAKLQLNFGGNANELWCEGGEVHFLLTLIDESEMFRQNCGWFTTLVSKEKNLEVLMKRLRKVAATEHQIIEMHQGTKTSRILAWRFNK